MKRFYHFNEDSRFEPPAPPELEEENFSEEIELHLDADVTVDKDGTWYYKDEDYPWAQPNVGDDWYTEHRDVRIGDVISIVETVDELIEPQMPAIAGEYHISADIKLVYDISGVEVDKFNHFEDDQGDLLYDEEVYTDNAEVELVDSQCTVSNFQFKRV